MILDIEVGKPEIHDSVWLAPSSCIIGQVSIGEGCSIWFNTVLRGDVAPIRIGKDVNVQDGAILHATYQYSECILEDRVSVGHAAILHGCKVERQCLIGMGAIVMDNAVIGENSLVGAGSLVSENKKFPPGSLILGRPGKVVRELSSKEIENLSKSADNYLMYQNWYKGEDRG